MRALDRKLMRDLWRLRGQVLAIGLVIASGVALMVMSLSTHDSLQRTAEAYYDRYRFAEVFATLKRAPDRLAERISAIPGVQRVETRVVRYASLDVPGVAEPVTGEIVSIPEHGTPSLNALAIRKGRSVQAGHPDEVVIGEPFADAHGLAPGSHFRAVLNGTRRTLTVVGVALSPEFVYAMAPGSLMPDDRHFGILWMGRKAVASAFDLEDSFNSVALTLLRGADPVAVIARLDDVLAPYGGTGAVARADQVSNWFVQNELKQLRNMSRILPSIFLAVAAFLTNMVLARLVATERSEIGLMKAFGYSRAEIGFHYAKLVAAICAVGILLGWGAGALLGQYNTSLYNVTFRFPFLYYQPGPASFAISGLVSLGAALAGALGAVRRAASLPPAEAMRPPAPPSYRHRGLGFRLPRTLDQPTRIILRQISRTPLRSLMTSAGVAFSVGVLVLALQWIDAIDSMVDTEFHQVQRQDVTLGLVEAQSRRALHEMAHLPGVLAVEPIRTVDVRFRAGLHHHRGGITGLPADARLNVIYDAKRHRTVPVPPGGVVLSTALADKLGVRVGDRIDVDVLEGRRPHFSLPVVRIVETYIGMTAWMNIDRLRRLMREEDGVSQAALLTDPAAAPALYARLKDMPDIASVAIKRLAIDKFYETMGEIIMIFVAFFAGFAAALSFGVTYNSARISLSERGRDLATLRVLGFKRVEISYILLGEIALLVLVGLAAGCAVGRGLASVMAASFDTELFRIPLVITPATYGFSVLGALIAALGSAVLVRRRLDRIDLIAVLKTRE